MTIDDLGGPRNDPDHGAPRPSDAWRGRLRFDVRAMAFRSVSGSPGGGAAGRGAVR